MLLTIERVLTLKTVGIFSNTPEEALVDLASVLEEVHSRPGETIIEKGEIGSSLYIVVSGKVRVHDGTTTLADLGPMCAVPTVVPDPGECQDDSDCAVTSDCRRVACVRGLCDDRQIPAGWPARVQADDASTTTDNCQVRRCGLDGKSTIVTGEPTQPTAGGCFTCDGGQVSPRDEGTACSVDGGVVCTVSGACVGKI